jgi:RNA polymerase sigma-70 factor (ECF subfamily)
MRGERDGDGEAGAFLRGDPDLVGRIEDAVRLVVRSFQLGDREAEKDLVQDALSRVLAGLGAGRFRGEASLGTYARNVARYTCLEHIRRRRWEADVDPEDLPSEDRWSAPERSFLWAEEHLRNLEAFAALPPECRELLRLVCLEGLSYQETAARLGISEAAVRSRIHRCRLTCREAAGLAARPARRARRGRRP